MSLVAIKQHFQKVRIATLAGLCVIFKMEPKPMQAMLEFWIKKGALRRCPKPNACQTPCSACLQCGIEKNEYYEWICT